MATKETKIDAAYLLNFLTDVMEADIAEGLDDNGKWLPFKQWPEKLRITVESIDFYENGAVKRVKFMNKRQAAVLIGKHVDVNAFGIKARKGNEGAKEVTAILTAARERVRRLEHPTPPPPTVKDKDVT